MTITYTRTRKNIFPALIILLCTITLTFQGCKKKHSEIATTLFEKTQNDIFKKIDFDDFAAVFKRVLDSEKTTLSHSRLITAYYAQNDYYPTFLMAQLQSNAVETLTGYYDKSNEHGFDPAMFRSADIKVLVDKFQSRTAIKTLDETYHDIAELEILTANSLINYSNDLQFGLINPKRIYSRYFMATQRPDSISMMRGFHVSNMKAYLDSIQPKDPQYIALQKAFVDGDAIPGLSVEESRRVLLVNLERLRWKNKPAENKYVIVNIPDYRLNVMDSGRAVLSMKVCVGQGRNMDNAKTLMHFDDTDKMDKPNIHETPILNSMINSVQVNPVWNIPQSIATKEIIVQAAQDPYYLSNSNIDVYKDGEKVDNTDSIDWATVNKSEYSFKQEPGADNSLGKIKFLFKNRSNVYLHDTPAKGMFYKKMRAVSHGCVRLGDPEGLALALFGKSWQYTMIDKDMGTDKPDPTTIDLPNKIPVYITYVTCWADENGTLQYRPDVYGMDIVLFAHLEKVLSN